MAGALEKSQLHAKLDSPLARCPPHPALTPVGGDGMSQHVDARCLAHKYTLHRLALRRRASGLVGSDERGRGASGFAIMFCLTWALVLVCGKSA